MSLLSAVQRHEPALQAALGWSGTLYVWFDEQFHLVLVDTTIPSSSWLRHPIGADEAAAFAEVERLADLGRRAVA